MRTYWSHVAVLLRLAVAVSGVENASAQSAPNVTGRWSGTYTETVTCGGRAYANTGAIDVTLRQSGSSVAGILKIDDLERNERCEVIDRIVLPLPSSGTISGTSLTLSVQSPTGRTTVAGAVTGETMRLSYGATFEATMTRVSSSLPDDRFNGTYAGTYSTTLQVCGGPERVMFSGPVTITIFQAGRDGAGFITLSGSRKDKCTYSGSPSRLTEARVVDAGTESVFFAAEIDGNTLNGFVLENQNNDEHLEDTPFTAVLSGSRINGGGGGTTFSADRRMTVQAPVVLRFGADSQTVPAGEPATLEWNVFHAASVDIDGGIGSQPPSGSITIRPAATTTYRLTAVAPDGTTTSESVTFTVGGGLRRRVVRH